MQRLSNHLRTGRVAFVCVTIGSVLPAEQGCTRSCTEMGCLSRVEVRFEPPITEAGRYRFELEIDGVSSSCDVDFVPERRDRDPEGCPSLFVQGSDVPTGAYGVTEGAPYRIIGFDVAPADEVSVAVYREDELWAEHAFEPVYRGVEINGPGCGECPIATERVPLP